MLKAQRRASTSVDGPEAELLLSCARIGEDSERAIRIRALLRKDMDWPYLLRTARAHGMMPLLYWHLNTTCPDAVPKTAMDELRQRFQDNARRNLFLTGELLRLLNLFEAQGIPTVPYKGPALAASVYGSLALRQFADLDILVHRQDVPRAKDLLLSSGYRPEYQLTRAQEAAWLHHACDPPFRRDDGASIVELHWDIMPRYLSFPLDTERLWERLAPISLGGKVVSTLSPEDLLLILCVHGSKHLWERLAWIRDVAGLIETHQEMDWGWVTRQAIALGGRRMLSIGLLLATDLLGVSLPERVSQMLKADPVAGSLAAEVRTRLFREVDDLSKIFEESVFHPFRLRMRERLRDRVRYCIRTAMTPSVADWESLSLPYLLSPLYYVLRPLRLGGKYGRRMVERFVR